MKDPLGWAMGLHIPGQDDGRRGFLELYESCRGKHVENGRWRRMIMSLARRSLSIMHEGRMIPLAGRRPAEENASDKGWSVCICPQGRRFAGCIGTIAPVCRNIAAEEIIQNAVSAGIHDPRFPSVRRRTVFP